MEHGVCIWYRAVRGEGAKRFTFPSTPSMYFTVFNSLSATKCKPGGQCLILYSLANNQAPTLTQLLLLNTNLRLLEKGISVNMSVNSSLCLYWRSILSKPSIQIAIWHFNRHAFPNSSEGFWYFSYFVNNNNNNKKGNPISCSRTNCVPHESRWQNWYHVTAERLVQSLRTLWEWCERPQADWVFITCMNPPPI